MTDEPAPRLDPVIVQVLRERLPLVAEHTIAAVTADVPGYAGAFGGHMQTNIENGVQMALAGFLRLAARGVGVDAGTPLTPAIDGAYALGRGEARSGRSADALLSAYRVGARVAWRELAATAVEAGVPAGMVASFAELVFAYIDELSAASVAGHADELESAGRARQRLLDQLAQGLLHGDSEATLGDLAGRADWQPPRTLTAVVLPRAQARPVLGIVDPRSLAATEAGLPEGYAVLLVADALRTRLLTSLAGRKAVAGPSRPWAAAHSSYTRARRGLDLIGDDDLLDTEARLPELVLGADPEALADLRTRALAPLEGLTDTQREKLTETLRAWLLHQGRREDVAEALFVHPQTVRYRMGQLREAYGDALDNPETVLELTLALA